MQHSNLTHRVAPNTTDTSGKIGYIERGKNHNDSCRAHLRLINWGNPGGIGDLWNLRNLRLQDFQAAENVSSAPQAPSRRRTRWPGEDLLGRFQRAESDEGWGDVGYGMGMATPQH